MRGLHFIALLASFLVAGIAIGREIGFRQGAHYGHELGWAGGINICKDLDTCRRMQWRADMILAEPRQHGL